jgi:hypothetical protein
MRSIFSGAMPGPECSTVISTPEGSCRFAVIFSKVAVSHGVHRINNVDEQI